MQPQQQINTFLQPKINSTLYQWQHLSTYHSKLHMDNCHQQLPMVNYLQQQLLMVNYQQLLLMANCHLKLRMVNYLSQQLQHMDNYHQLQSRLMGNYHQMHMVKWLQPLNNIQLGGNKYTHRLQVMFNNLNSNNNNLSNLCKDQDKVPNIDDDINT